MKAASVYFSGSWAQISAPVGFIDSNRGRFGMEPVRAVALVAPRSHWQAAIDLLAVRSYTIRGQATEELRELNVGPGHSGLTIYQFADPARL